MDKQALEFLSKHELFSLLPETEIRALVEVSNVKQFQKGTTLAEQAKTLVENVYVIRSGALELFYEKDGGKTLGGLLAPGDIFGAISILMYSGIAVRTVNVVENTVCCVIPRKDFLKLCARHSDFHQHFVDDFSDRMRNESYASIVATAQAANFLSNVDPFSFLPYDEIESLASEISIVFYPKGTILLEQGRSNVTYLYIIQKGAAERYFEQEDKKTLKGKMCEGDIFGGISILLNDGIAVRTLQTTEDSHFYRLPKAQFMELCRRHENFVEYFTDAFGKRMLDRTYASSITRTSRPRDEALQFFNQPVTNVYSKNLVFCDIEVSIQHAAEIMSRNRCSSIFVKDREGDFIGVVTDNDLRRKVIVPGIDIGMPVSQIMSSPLSAIPSQALVFEALMTMMQKNLKHLAVKDMNNKVIGVLTNSDLLNAQGQSPLFLIREISNAESLEEISDKHAKLPRLIWTLINNGAKSENVTRFITTISDAILNKIIGFAIRELGPAPVEFAFVILGSEGRKEQTLKTDQDNALIFRDVSKKKLAAVSEYFLKFGESVSGMLDQAGYAFCKGDVMARNPKWCQPISKWKEYFVGWIRAGNPEDLLQASIFFDFRLGYGQKELIEELQKFLFDSLKGWSGFFRNMTENALHFKPPIGFFRNFVVESKGKHRNELDIKSAMQPIVDLARIYSLKHQVDETNTMERLKKLQAKKVLQWNDYMELEHAYGFLMQMRFIRQVTAVTDENQPPDNYINPKKLSRIEQKMLKEVFRRIEKFQDKLSLDFTGIV